MWVGFQHPSTGIPCIGEWDEYTNELTFYIEDEEKAEEYNNPKDLKEVLNWCEWKARNDLDSAERVNQYLNNLGIMERLEMD